VPVAGQVSVVEGDLSACDHGDLDSVVGLEPVEEGLEGQGTLSDLNLVVVGETLGQHRHRAAHDRVKVLRHVLLDVIGLTEEEERKGEVDEGVLELGDIVELLGELEDLVADDTGDHGGGGRDGGDDLAGNHLSLVTVALSDLVVSGAQVRARVDEVDVEVIVVILLEVGGGESFTWQGGGGDAERVEELGNNGLVVVALDCSSRGRTASLLTLLGLFRGLNNDDLLDVGRRWKLRNEALGGRTVNGGHAKVCKDQVGAVVNEFETSLVFDVEDNRLGRSLRAGPEGLARGGCVVIGEESLKIADRVVVVFVKDVAGFQEAAGDVSSFLEFNELRDIGELMAHT